MRESLIALVSRLLRTESVPFAVIGAASLAVHGYPRTTIDLDLLTTDARVLQFDWPLLVGSSIAVELRHGDVSSLRIAWTDYLQSRR